MSMTYEYDVTIPVMGSANPDLIMTYEYDVAIQ